MCDYSAREIQSEESLSGTIPHNGRSRQPSYAAFYFRILVSPPPQTTIPPANMRIPDFIWKWSRHHWMITSLDGHVIKDVISPSP
jgi:hypothetical protein